MKYYFSIHLSCAEFLPYYEGKIHSIVVTTNQGIKVQFPAMHIRKYLTNKGIQGYFYLETKQNKFLSIIKLS